MRNPGFIPAPYCLRPLDFSCGTHRIGGRCTPVRPYWARHDGNAVLAVRFDTGVFANVMNEVAAYGTAVTVEPLA